MQRSFWDFGAYRVVATVCVLFFVLTIVAMLLYPGGSVADTKSNGYSFFGNFFSDLGQTHTYGGSANWPSLAIFTFALCATAIGLAIFFIAFSRFFRDPAARAIARLGAACGIAAALCFVGVAFTPWNLYLHAHNSFVNWAFRAYLVATVALLVSCLLERGFPRRFAWVFAGFAVLLSAYVLLLALGPAPGTPQGALVQATGQKVIVYASIATVLIQALGAPAVHHARSH